MSDDNTRAALRKAAATVHLPGDAGYDEARSTWAVSSDLRPAAVIVPESADEVSAVLRAAGEAGLRVSPLGTGHNAYPLRDLSGTVLLRMSRLGGIEIRPEARTARVEAGAIWLPVVQAAAEHGLTGMHGSAVDVGVVGYHVFGGISWYGRQYGLASNRVTAFEVVLADGTQVRADAGHEADLFWALRGGGGNFGVVTAMEFGLLPFATAYAGMLAWDLTAAPQVLDRWRQWTAELPESVTTAYRHTQFPPIPQIPDPFRGRQWAIVDGAILAGDDEAERILAPLRELRPELDTFARVPATAVPHIHMDPEAPTPGAADSGLIDGLTPSVADKLLELSGPGSGFGLVAAELRHLGGALSRPAGDGGAVSHLDGEYNVLGAGFAFDPDGKAATLAEAGRLVAALGGDGKHYLGLDQRPQDARAGYDDATWRRLTELRRHYDPNGVLLANHEI
nr:FAD-binding oxidoreductase [uncultured Actinoplanes sp.]